MDRTAHTDGKVDQNPNRTAAKKDFPPGSLARIAAAGISAAITSPTALRLGASRSAFSNPQLS